MASTKQGVGRVAVVTGAGSGIGRALCLALVQAGAKVVVADLHSPSGHTTVELAGGANNAVFINCDVTNESQLMAAMSLAKTAFGSFDIMINNAGIVERGDFLCESTVVPASHSSSQILRVDLEAVVLGSKLAVQLFRRAKTNGVVINVASMAGLIPVPFTAVYCAAKAGVVHFTRSLGYLAHEGIRVNCICPSFVDTPMVQDQIHQDMMAQAVESVGGLLPVSAVVEGMMELISDTTKAGAVMRVTLKGGCDYWPVPRPRTPPTPKL